MYNFRKVTNGFNFVFEEYIEPMKTEILKMPTVSPNKRGINDIGFATDNGITLYATISSKPDDEATVWQEIRSYDEINKVTSYIKIVNSSNEKQRVNIRVILN